MSIPEGYKANFETLLKAAKNGDLALVECTDTLTSKPVFTLCAIGHEGGEYAMSPLAKMFDGNPFDELNPPQ